MLEILVLTKSPQYFCKYTKWLMLYVLQRTKMTLAAKIGNLMEVPSIVLMDGLFKTGNREVYFPGPLMEFWRQSVQPPPPGQYSSFGEVLSSF